jgi:ABC-2 type transport system permease protein
LTTPSLLSKASPRQQLVAAHGAGAGGAGESHAQGQYIVDVDSTPTEEERAALQKKVSARTIDSFVWLTDDAIAARKVTWWSRDVGGFAGGGGLREQGTFSTILTQLIMRRQLSANGLKATQIAELLKPVAIESIRIGEGRELKGSGTGKVLEIVVMVVLLYMAVLFYGIAVMRSVLEEKTSRVMEVLLSSATSTELMTGKLIGVGAVGLTQVVVWAVMAGISMPSLALHTSLSELQISPVALLAFGVFFLLGYLLYSTMYATIGAICTTEQEGQQLQFLVVIPLVLSVFMLMPVLRSPDAPAMVWVSLVPFFAPVVMFTRIIVQMPPAWEIALSLFLLIATTGALLVLGARIYRVGILMYGKRLTLPEVWHWMTRSRV